MANVSKFPSRNCWRVSYTIHLKNRKIKRAKYAPVKAEARLMAAQLEQVERATRNRLANQKTIEEWIGRGWIKREEAMQVFDGYKEVVERNHIWEPTDYAEIAKTYERHWLETNSREVISKNLSADRSHMRATIAWLEASFPTLEELTVDQVRDYLHDLRTQFSERTISHRLTKLRQLLDHAIILGMIGDNAARKVNLNQVGLRLVPSSKERRILQTEEIQRVLDTSLAYRHWLSGSIPTVVRLGLYAGLRNQEMCWLKWDAINWDNRIITVKEATCEVTGETWVPKDYEIRRLDVKLACIDYLKEERVRQKKAGLLGPFVMPGGNVKKPGFKKKPLYQDAPQKAFVRMVKAEGWDEEITVYSLRHTYATMALRSGIDIRTLQRRMGHSDIKTTMEYLHFIEPEAHPMDKLPY